MKTETPLLIALATVGLIATACNTPMQAKSFSWNDKEGVYRDLMLENRPVARYAYERLDKSSGDDRERTFKPFYHIYDWEGENFITKGPGGLFTHHRGIYFGFNEITFTREDGSIGHADTWHGRRGAYQEHIDFITEESDSQTASLTTSIAWHGEEGEFFATEYRKLTFSYNNDGDLVVDFAAILETDLPKVNLDGDAQHAGVQFRATNEVAEATKEQTYYIRPDGVDAPGKTRNAPKNPDKKKNPGTFNLPYKAMSFVTGDERYTVVYLDHDGNPRPTWHSERDYGRFGAYFVAEITKNEPLRIDYRFVIRKGEFEQDELAALAEQYERALERR